MTVPDPISLAMNLIKQGHELLAKAAANLHTQGGGTPPAPVGVANASSKAAEVKKAAYASLLPKLLVLSETIDTMSDDEYRAWPNTLTADEFYEFIRIQDTQATFQAAVSEAKRLTQAPKLADGIYNA